MKELLQEPGVRQAIKALIVALSLAVLSMLGLDATGVKELGLGL